MRAFLLVLLLTVTAGLAQCSDYSQKADSLASSCDFHSILSGQPNVYHCFEAGKSYIDAAECVSLYGGDPSQYYEKALYYLENSIPKLSEEGDHPAKARAYENIARVYADKGDLSSAEENYQLAVREYSLAREYSEADRVRQLIASLGLEQESPEEQGVVNPELGESMLSYYFMIAVSATVLALFFLIAFRVKRRRKSPELVVRHASSARREEKPSEPEKTVEEEKEARAKSAKERVKEKLRRKYAPRK